MKFAIRTIYIVTITLLLIHCGKEKKGDAAVVAGVGDEEISFLELEKSFLLEPRYTIRTPLSQARRMQLDYLVQNKYYYLAAQTMALANDSLVKYRLNYIRNHETLIAYIKETFLDSVKIGTAELTTALNRYSQQREVKNIFTKNQEEAIRLESKLNRPVSDTNHYFREYGEDLGWITFGNVDPAVEEAVYTLNKNEISGVVQSSYGYHILKVVNIRDNVDFKNINDRMRLQNVTNVIRKRKADGGIREYLSSLAGGHKIQINNRLIEVMLSHIYTTTEGQTADPVLVAPPVTNRELINIQIRLEDIEEQPLVKFREKTVTVGAFLERLKEMPPFHRPYLKGRGHLLKSVLDMIRNDLLMEQALATGYDDKSSVRKNYHQQREEYLAREFGIRYHSKRFQEEYPDEWQKYDQALTKARDENELSVHLENMFPDVSNPDSILTVAPVQVFLKNRYVW